MPASVCLFRRWARLFATVVLGGSVCQAATPTAPTTPIGPVVDRYFGVELPDPYRWLEDTRSASFTDWVNRENNYTRAVLASIPNRDTLLARIQSLESAGTWVSSVQVASGTWVYQMRKGGQDGYKLYVRRGLNGPEKLLLEPRAGTTRSESPSIAYLQLAPDGAHVVVGMTESASDDTVMRIIDTRSGETLHERIDRAQYAAPAWLPDGRSFFYNRLAPLVAGAAERDQYLNSKAYLHRLGDEPARDRVMLAAGSAPAVPIAPVDAPVISTAAGSPYAVAVNYHGPALDVTVYVEPLEAVLAPAGRGSWRKAADVQDQVSAAVLHQNDLYLLSHKNAARFQILKLDASEPDVTRALTVVPQSDVVIQDMTVARDGLYFRVLDGGLQRVRRLDFSTNKVSDASSSATTGGISELSANPEINGALFPVTNWAQPQRWYQFDPTTRAVTGMSLGPASRLDTSGYEVTEVRARAPDGAQVPLSLVQRRGLQKDSQRPTLLTVYGAYGTSLTPRFVPGWIAFLERGGLVAIAHTRGGGEFGEGWHSAGMQATKPNTHRDLIACAQYLIHERYTRPGKLGIAGTEAGGLAVGMAMTERPDLFRAVLSDAGDFNALRAEHEAQGEAKSLEYGSVSTRVGLDALRAIDAVSHVKDGTAYPATFLTVSRDVPQVAPWQPAKMAARLQAANVGGRPILLRVDNNTAPESDPTSTPAPLLADQLAFLLWQTGDSEFQPRAP